MKRLGTFLSYHNAVPIALGILFLGATGVFAATNPETILSSEESVVSIDNTYIANKDLSSFTPQVRINSVIEDDEFYYVQYNFETIDLNDSVWQDVVKSEVLKVSKEQLGQYRDLGLYAMEQLQQKIDREIAYLKEVQEIEKRQVSQKQVATAYSGLVGAFLDDTTETLPGYTPVVTPPPAPVQESGNGSSDNSDGSGDTTDNTAEQNPHASDAPVLQVLGNNPVEIPLNTNYADLGAVVTDDRDGNLGIKVLVNGIEVQEVSIDTREPGIHVIAYQATDSDGNTGESTRTVVVFDPNAPTEEQEEQTTEQETSEAPVEQQQRESQEESNTSNSMQEEAPTNEIETSGEVEEPPTEEEVVETPLEEALETPSKEADTEMGANEESDTIAEDETSVE